MNAFTPGPWEFEAEPAVGVFVHDAQGTVAEIMCDQTRIDDRTAIANARLIAAAPELVDALENLVIDANTVDACYSRNPGNFALALQTMRESIEQARAAIDKATGEQS